MSETTDQPIIDIPDQTTVPVQTAGQLPRKGKAPLVWIVLPILILAVAGGVYCYFNFRQTLTPFIAPTESLELIPISTEVSSSTDVNTLEKELNNTDLGSFETDLDQLDLDAGQL